ncbi:hypothetical protein ACFHWD_03985 [Clostridium sp. MT-14]
MRKLNINKLNNKKHIYVSSEEALKDIIPFNWSKDVLNGKKRVIIK